MVKTQHLVIYRPQCTISCAWIVALQGRVGDRFRYYHHRISCCGICYKVPGYRDMGETEKCNYSIFWRNSFLVIWRKFPRGIRAGVMMKLFVRWLDGMRWATFCGSGDFWSDRVDWFIGNHSDFPRFSRYLILDFSPLFWNNTVGLNDYVHL